MKRLVTEILFWNNKYNSLEKLRDKSVNAKHAAYKISQDNNIFFFQFFFFFFFFFFRRKYARNVRAYFLEKWKNNIFQNVVCCNYFPSILSVDFFFFFLHKTMRYVCMQGRIQRVCGEGSFDSKFHFHGKFWINSINLEYHIYPK